MSLPQEVVVDNVRFVFKTLLKVSSMGVPAIYTRQKRLREEYENTAREPLHTMPPTTSEICIKWAPNTKPDTLDYFAHEFKNYTICKNMPGVARCYGMLAVNKVPGIILEVGIPLNENASLDIRLKVFADIVDGIADMHKVELLHGDVKMDNVIMVARGKEMRAVLIDLGNSMDITNGGDGSALAPKIFTPPEQLISHKITTWGDFVYTTKSDVWTLAASYAYFYHGFQFTSAALHDEETMVQEITDLYNLSSQEEQLLYEVSLRTNYTERISSSGLLDLVNKIIDAAANNYALF